MNRIPGVWLVVLIVEWIVFMQSITIRKPCRLACDLQKVYIVDSIVHEYAVISVVCPGIRVCCLQQGNGSSVHHVAPNGDMLDTKALSECTELYNGRL